MAFRRGSFASERKAVIVALGCKAGPGFRPSAAAHHPPLSPFRSTPIVSLFPWLQNGWMGFKVGQARKKVRPATQTRFK